MLTARSIAQGARKVSVSSYYCICAFDIIDRLVQVLRPYSASATAGFAGQKGSNVSDLDVFSKARRLILYFRENILSP